MTQEKFLSGTPFTIGAPTYKGAPTFYYQDNTICRQSRSSIDEKVILDNYEANIVKVGTKGFSAFTFVIDKKVVVRYKFEDLVEFIKTPMSVEG
jgi:hypothetical protein